jgi:hypothetical protein
VLEWKDYVRGKDLAKWLREKQAVLDQHTRAQGPSECHCRACQDLVVRLLDAKLLLSVVPTTTLVIAMLAFAPHLSCCGVVLSAVLQLFAVALQRAVKNTRFRTWLRGC